MDKRNILTTVLTVYNGEKYIGDTLKSLAWQTRRPDRVILLDNVSTDATVELVRSFPGIQCEWVINEKNLGCFGNFNRALSYATETDYLHILHCDDILKPQFYEHLTQALDNAPAPAMGYCKASNFEVGTVPADAQSPVPHSITSRVISQSAFLRDRAELKAFPFCCVLIKTGRTPVQSRFRTDIPLAGDMVFWSDLALESRQIAEVNSTLLLNGIHRHSKSPDMKGWILDDWNVMQMIEQKRGLTGLRRWLRREKMACKFAARCASKRKTIQSEYPEAAAQVVVEAKKAVGPFHWQMGMWAAKLLGKA